jgi:hypothetical protein
MAFSLRIRLSWDKLSAIGVHVCDRCSLRLCESAHTAPLDRQHRWITARQPGSALTHPAISGAAGGAVNYRLISSRAQRRALIEARKR